MNKTSAVSRSSRPRLDRYVSTHESVGFVVREVWRLFARCLQPRIAREGVSIGMWFVLRMLWDEDGMTQRELGERVGINGPTMVAALNSMERAGLVKRVHNRTDRRKINVFLTERGRKLKSKLWPMAAEVLAMGLAGLSPSDVRSLNKMLAQIRLNLERDQFA
ncbi:MAG TPA: MarR family winged helix-turn-helix transcriptional regulator [Pseudolabrys sp.]|nr:MarR family winged helix-turn-helix transcriptional regulator [Pseudolabrys sp.]